MTMITTAEWTAEVEEIVQEHRRWYARNHYKKVRATRSLQTLQYYYDHLAVRKAQKKRWLQRNRDKQNAYDRKYRLAKKEKCRCGHNKKVKEA